jgi:GH3 auxin-responsive promoter
MSFLSPLAPIADLGPVRSLVNAGFLAYSKRRVRELEHADPIGLQEQTLRDLVREASNTRFGLDHRFGAIDSVADYQAAVPLRTYEEFWNSYLKDRYPVFDNLAWPGRIPFLATTSGTTSGSSKYIPVTGSMVASNRKAAQTMIAQHLANTSDSRLFRGKLFMLGGSTALDHPASGVGQGDLSAITAQTVSPLLRPYSFPPIDLALDPVWDRKLTAMAERSLSEPITLVSGVTSVLLSLFQRLIDLSGKATVAEVWPTLEVVVHGGVKFDPYRESTKTFLGDPSIRIQESYPCSEGFIAYGDQETGLLRLVFDHGIFYEFVPLEELGSERPTRHWLGNAEVGVNYAIVVSTCAGLWSHVIGDTIRFERIIPPLLSFTGRTRYTLSPFGEHLISEEIEGAIARASASLGASVKDWHVGAVFDGSGGHHRYVVEFLREISDLVAFRKSLDEELRRENEHYAWFRAEGGGMPAPAVVVSKPGGFDDWMRSMGKLGGQHKVPRIDSSGKLTDELVAFLESRGAIANRLPEGTPNRVLRTESG